MIQTVRERIYQAIVDYCNASQKPVGRQQLARITGYKLSVVDEHIKVLKNIECRIYSETPGYFQPVAQFGPDRDISVTVLTSGMRKIEIGDLPVVEVTPHEWAMLGSLASGSGKDLADRQDERHLLATIASLKGRVRECQKQLATQAMQFAKAMARGQPDMFDFQAHQPERTTQ